MIDSHEQACRRMGLWSLTADGDHSPQTVRAEAARLARRRRIGNDKRALRYFPVAMIARPTR